MDVERKWSDRDIRSAKNLVRIINKMKMSEEFLGLEIPAFADALQWLKDLILVMENPPKEFVPQITQDVAAPAAQIEGL